MNPNPEVKEIAAIYSPFKVRPSFVYPILEEEGRTFFQETGDTGLVTGFVPIGEDLAKDFQEVAVRHKVVIGEDAIYGFQFGSGEILLGTRHQLATDLHSRIEELTPNPYTLRSAISFIEKVLPETSSSLTAARKTALMQITQRLEHDNKRVSREWLNLNFLSRILRHTDAEGYISYWNLMDELENVTTELQQVFIRVKLVRSLIGTSPELKGRVTSFGFSTPKINRESRLLSLDEHNLINLKMAARHVLVTEVRIPSDVDLVVQVVDPLATRKRYLKKDPRKIVRNRSLRDYMCVVLWNDLENDRHPKDIQ